MDNYDSKKFIDALTKKMGKNTVPRCPYCNGNKFSSTPQFASILIGNNLEELKLGTSVPSGMLICQNCGHIEFFALGVLGLLEKKEDSSNAR